MLSAAERTARVRRMDRISAALRDEARRLNAHISSNRLMLEIKRGYGVESYPITEVRYSDYDGLTVVTGKDFNQSSWCYGNDVKWAELMAKAGLERSPGWDGK